MDTALISTTSLSAEMRELLEDACAELGLDAEFHDLRLVDGARVPALLMAVLPAGQRNVPNELARLAERDFRATPVLLLCEESLVRGAISLEDGRLVLIGAPHTARALRSRMRVALVRGDRPSHLLDRHEGSEVTSRSTQSALEVREHRSSPCWIATLETPAETRKLDLQVGEREVSARWNGADEVVRFDATNRAWHLRGSNATRGLYLVSERRYPVVWDLIELGRQQASDVHRIAAASGDVVVAVLGESGDRSSRWKPSREFLEAAERGGPEALECLSSELRDARAQVDAVILEVR